MKDKEDEPKIKVSALIPTSILEAIKMKGKREDRTISGAINRIFQEYFNKHGDKQAEEE